MAGTDSVAKVDEEKLKGELKVELQNSEARVIAQVEFVRGVVDHVSRSNVILNIGSPDHNAYLDFTIIAPPSDDASIFP